MRNNLPAAAANTTPQPDQLVLDTRQFAPNPAKVASDHNSNKLCFAFVGGITAAAISYYSGRSKLSTNNRLLTTVCSTALGAVGGGLIGGRIKTSEESRSEVLLKAAHSGNFAESIKKDMERRENNAFLLGAITGFPLWL